MNTKTLALFAGIVFVTTGPAQAQIEFYVGQIITTGASFCPEDFLEVNGQILLIEEFPALAAVLGLTYGGDGRTTFGLPTIPNTVTATGATVLNCICVEGETPPH